MLRLVVAIALMAFGIISWPLAALTFAKDEPQFLLALSELALIYEAFNAIQVAWDAKKVEE